MERVRVKITANEHYSNQFGILKKGDIVVTDRAGGQHLVDDHHAGEYVKEGADDATENDAEAQANEEGAAGKRSQKKVRAPDE